MATQEINLNKTTPPPPADAVNGTWQADAPSLDPTVVRNASVYFSKFGGDTGSGGTMGLVPAPAAGDAAAGKFLKADGSFQVPPTGGGGGGGLTAPVEIDTSSVTSKGLIVKGSVFTGTATPTFVQGKYAAGGGVSLSATFDSDNIAGNSIIAIGFNFLRFVSTSVSDTNGNGYTQVATGPSTAIIFIASNIRSGPNTVTIANAGNIDWLLIMEWSGLAALAYDVSSINFANSPFMMSVTTTVANDLLLSVNLASPGTPVISSGHPEVFSASESLSPSNIGVYAGTAATATTYSETFDSSPSANGTYAVLLALKPFTGTLEQEANLIEIQDSSGAVLSAINGQGEFILASTSGMPTDTPAECAVKFDPATGLLWIYGSSGWQSYSPGSGGGGGGGGGGTPGGLFQGIMSVPTISGTGLTTGFNHASSFSASDVPTGIKIADTNAYTGSYLQGILAAYPSSPFTVTALFSLPLFGQNFQGIGLCINASPTGNLMTFYLIWPSSGSTWNFIVDAWNSPTSHNSGPLGRTGATDNFAWIRLKDDGTNISFYASSDGLIWYLLWTSAKASTFLGASGFNYLGAFLESGDTAGGPALGTTLMSWDITFP